MKHKISIFIVGGVLLSLSILSLIFFFDQDLDSQNQVSMPEETIVLNSPSETLAVIPQSDSATNYILNTLLIILAFTTLISVSISFYLYKWRKILLSNSNMIVPEEWAQHLFDVSKHVDLVSTQVIKVGGMVNSDLDRVTNVTSDNSSKISSMIDTYMQLQSALDDKDAEIRRLKDGYDTEVFRRFLSRFIRIDQTVDEFIMDEGENTALSQLHRLFEDAFEECSVYKFQPEVGEDYRNAYGIADNPKIVQTDDQNKDHLIAEVLEPGYHIDTGMNKKIIIRSKVKIYQV